MNKRDESYIKLEGLDKLVDFKDTRSREWKIDDSVSGNFKGPFPPRPDDLVLLHRLIRSRKAFTVLEFGCGNSTMIIADALQKNSDEWEALSDKPDIRNRFMHKLFSVDADWRWLFHVKSELSSRLENCNHVILHYSIVEIGTYNGQLCHYYKNLPDIVPDFVYLDGPFPKDVRGKINGLSFQCNERTVMAADLLLLESTFLPGTFILVDGRINNVRFLERNFTRNYNKVYYESDHTSFELTETRLGKYNILGFDYF